MSPEKGTTERLQVVLARFGIASRRGVVSMIEEGKVEINGTVILEKGFRVDTSKDKIKVEGQELATGSPQKKIYYAFNKPKGVMTTLQDPHAESTVADFFKDTDRVFPVGRLDRDTTGLLILTNDGELAFRLTHPKFGVPKRYYVRVKGAVTEAQIKKLEAGVELEEGRTAPCQIRVQDQNSRYMGLLVVLHEGKKRQIRRIFDKIGHKVVDLVRLNYGPLELGELEEGQKRLLTSKEVHLLYEATGLSKAKTR